VDQDGSDGNFTSMKTPTFAKRTFVLFYLVDCSGKVAKMPDTRNRFTGQVELQNAESHFPDNESYYMTFIIIFGLGFTFLSIIMFRDFLFKCRKSQELNKVYLMVNISLILKATSFPFEILHFWIFSYDGSGIEFFNFLGQAFNYLSQYILTIT
jgi:hypothetical protein